MLDKCVFKCVLVLIGDMNVAAEWSKANGLPVLSEAVAKEISRPSVFTRRSRAGAAIQRMLAV